MVPAVAAAGRDITLEDVPPAVRATIQREVAGGQIDEIEEDRRRDGRIVYEVEFWQGDRKFEIDIAPDGTLLKRTED
ncbi:MAG TPA: hypothetical protein VKY73_15500 [Polyangiaceae bacterium]|nr:hypothetical protein [Polyangiaceae bacterium]